MTAVIQGLWPVAAVVLVVGAVIGWDRLREPHRDPARPMAVVDRRTYQAAVRRIARLESGHDPYDIHARTLRHSIRGRVMHRVERTGMGWLQSLCRRPGALPKLTHPRAMAAASEWSAERYWYPDCPLEGS